MSDYTAWIALGINVAGIVFMGGMSFATIRNISERVSDHNKILHNGGEGLVVKIARMEESHRDMDSKLDHVAQTVNDLHGWAMARREELKAQ